jgi:hypothetical protein
MPLPWPALVFAGSASVLLTLLARAALLRAPLRADSQHRAASSLASVGVLACASLLGRHGLAYGCATLFGHMLADLASCALLGPATSRLMLAHHAVTMFLTGMGLAQMHWDAPPLRAMLANAASVLLWMEATNPFLHACTLVSAEPALAHLRRAVLPAGALGLVGSFLYFRVLALPLLLPSIWRYRRELAPLGEAYCAVVAALALLQWWWFWKICAKVWRDGARKAPRP